MYNPICLRKRIKIYKGYIEKRLNTVIKRNTLELKLAITCYNSIQKKGDEALGIYSIL
jgi:hypothetical protein